MDPLDGYIQLVMFPFHIGVTSHKIHRSLPQLNNLQSLAPLASRMTMLTRLSPTAYWIAFGPHGPRALPPPGENWAIFKYTMLGVGLRRPLHDHTVIRTRRSQDHERAVPEDDQRIPQGTSSSPNISASGTTHLSASSIGHNSCKEFSLINFFSSISAEPKNRAHNRYIIRRLRRQGHGAEQASKGRATEAG